MAKANSEPQRDPLVTLAAADSSAFILLYDIYYEKVFRYCANRLRSKQISEDITSMVFISAARNIRRFGGKTRTEFIDWLYTIAAAEIERCLKEKQFAELVKKSESESVEAPDVGQKEKLRAKILSVFDSADKNIGRIFFYITAVVIILIAAGISLRPGKISKKTAVSTIPKSRSETPKPPNAAPAKIINLNAGKPAAAAEQSKTIPAAAAEKKIKQMPPKIEFGGIVKNQQLKPIEDATVRVLARFVDDANKPNISLVGTFTTDANGIWRCESLPEGTYQASIMVTHPDYIQPENPPPATIEQLKNFSFITILEKGITVIGRAVDSGQKPLPATIIRGPFNSENKKNQICDANGWFRFANVTPGIEVFTAQCAGATPQIKPVDVKTGMPPIIFTLEPANIIRGKVVDVNNVPIKDVLVAVSSWQGIEALNFKTKTDANGFFEWADAPADEVSFDIHKSGYMSIRNFAMKSESDYTITLLPPFRISGSVTCSEPNRPIETFIITLGYYFDKDKIDWQDANSIIFSGKKYELAVTEPLDFQLKIQTTGFQPAQSPVLNSEQNLTKYDFILKPIKAAQN